MNPFSGVGVLGFQIARGPLEVICPALNSHGHGPLKPKGSTTKVCGTGMSNLAGSPTLAQPSTPATPSSAAPHYTPYPAESANGNFSRTTSTSELPTSASATETQGESSKLNGALPKPIVAVNVEAVLASARQRGAQKGRNAEETEAMAQTAARYAYNPLRDANCTLSLTRRVSVLCRVAQRIAEDQLAVLQPDVETPFADAADVVRRLLPYHVFQHPAEDLHTLSGRKGKRKATEEDLLREEIAGSHTLQKSFEPDPQDILCRDQVCP